MAKMKIDLSGAKQFFFQKGEKVGLVACTALMVLIVGYALYSGFSSRGAQSGKPWDAAIIDGAKALDSAINRAALPESDTNVSPIDIRGVRWLPVPSIYQFGSMFVIPDKASTRKLNPFMLSPLPFAEDEKHFQFDYIRGGYFGYDIDPSTKKAWIIQTKEGGGGGGMPPNAPNAKNMIGGGQGGAGNNLTKVLYPTRMVVVSAIFPMRAQLEEFRKALRYATIPELLAHRDELPNPLGIEVSRCEILPDGKAMPWQPLFQIDSKGKAVITPSIKNMMRHMIIDDENPVPLANFIFPGLVTPLPKLANAEYAKLDLKGFDVKDVAADVDNKKPAMERMAAKPGVAMPNVPQKKNMMPAMEQPGAAAGGDIQERKESWTKLSKELKDKFEEKYFMFDPLGQIPAAAPVAEKKDGAAMMPSKGSAMMMPPQGGMAGKEGAGGALVKGWDAILVGAAAGGGALPMKDEPPEGEAPKVQAPTVQLTDALIRFFDPDVQPGKSYRYVIRIRMANPNFGKHKDVEYTALADQKELEPVRDGMLGWTITPAITIPGDYHWYALDQAPAVKVKGGADFKEAPKETTPIQVHRWIDRLPEQDSVIADWAIAERLYARRGEPVGRPEVRIEVLIWNRKTQAFEIGSAAHAAAAKIKGGKKAAQPKGDVPIDSGLPVDLTTMPPSIVVDFEGGKKSNNEDAAAFDVLVLTPDGKLVMRNSRQDLDKESSVGQERLLRYEHWRERVSEVRAGGQPGAGGGGIAMPGGIQRGN